MGLLDDAIREHLELKRQHGASDEEIIQAEQEALAPARRDPAAGAGVPPVEHVPGEQPAPAAEAPPPPTMPPAADAPPPPDLEPAAAEPVADQPTQIRAVPPVEESAPAEADVPDTGAVPLGEQQEDYLAPEPLDESPAAHPPLESTTPIEPPAAEPEAEAEVAPPPGTPKPHGDPAIGDRSETAAPSYDDEFDPDEVPADEALGSSDPPPPADPYRARTSILDDPLREGPPPPSEPGPEGEQDVLEETPDFLQETPEHDKLWFEQKPPRDFDFD
jgi:formin 2